MAESQDESGEREDPDQIVIRQSRFRRVLTWVAVGVLVFLVIALIIAWTQRREIARDLIERQLESSGVEAEYSLDRVGLRTQQISNLRIGDPENPDLTADRLRIQMRLKWDGSVDVYRIVARGVRLRGKVLPDGSVSWGQLDKLLPPPGDQPFRLPDVAVDVADSSISLRTPWGPFGFAIRGSGNLTGGFKGRFVSSSPSLDTGNCVASNIRGSAAIEIQARRPHVVGPLTADRFACPDSQFSIAQPRLELDARFGEGFDSYDATARIISERLIAGENGLAALNGRITLSGTPADTRGEVNLTARRSRLGTISAERTRVQGKYRMSPEAGTLIMVGDYVANDASLDPSMISGLTDALAAASATPIGPVASRIGNAIRRSASSFNVAGDIRVVNFPGYGATRITDARIRTQTGGQARLSGGKGVTYYWPSGKLRIDGTIQMSGGGLPTGTITLSQPRPSGPLSGVARFAPYEAAGSRLEMAPLRFTAEADGTTRFETQVRLTGAFPDGRVRGLQLPIEGRIGPAGKVIVAPDCFVARFDSFTFRDLTLNRDSVRICPTGEAVIVQPADGDVRIGARLVDLDVSGTLGETPIRVSADWARAVGQQFALADARMLLGSSESPVVVTADMLRGTFRGAGISGTISDATAVIGKVPLLMSDIDGDWLFRRGDLTIDGDVVVSDRADPPRFYPQRSRDFEFLLSGNDIRAGGTLRHPETGTEVMDVAINHDLETGAGSAIVDVEGLTFGPNLQPEELTRLTEGVVALVEGTISGRGRINWSGDGEVTSTGDFATRDMDLALPFGPVEGLTTSIHFTDLLGLVTAPGQIAQVDRINPGIIVENGVIRYQILPDQLVKVERGEWPFMGGRLILHETILNFGAATPKRLTFELVGFDAKMFVDSLGFEGLEITGIFDGVLPMIFAGEGGRIVGGRLESRPPGGRFRYTGTKPDAGLMAGVVFDLLSDIRYESMVIRLEGELAGEFATRFTISDISLGTEGGFVAGLVRGAFSRVPLRVNLNIVGPFRALIQMAKGFEDPTPVIEPVMPFPLDAPGMETEVRTIRKEEDQTQVQPPEEEIDISTQPPQPSE